MFPRRGARRPGKPASTSTGFFAKCVDFISGFYCVYDSVLVLILLSLLLFLFILYLSGQSMADVTRAITGSSTVYLVVSSLDTEKDLPVDLTKEGAGWKETDQRVISKNSKTPVKWQVTGATTYMQSFPKKGWFGEFGKLPFGERLSSRRHGFWIFQLGPQEEKAVTPPVIKCTGILSKIDNPDDIEVAVAMKAFVDGAAAVYIEYVDTFSRGVHTETLPNHVFRKVNFCSQILKVPFNKRVHEIVIKPISTNPEKNGIVIVDQVLVIIARKDRTESIIHTLVPNNWCPESTELA